MKFYTNVFFLLLTIGLGIQRFECSVDEACSAGMYIQVKYREIFDIEFTCISEILYFFMRIHETEWI